MVDDIHIRKMINTALKLLTQTPEEAERIINAIEEVSVSNMNNHLLLEAQILRLRLYISRTDLVKFEKERQKILIVHDLEDLPVRYKCEIDLLKLQQLSLSFKFDEFKKLLIDVEENIYKTKDQKLISRYMLHQFNLAKFERRTDDAIELVQQVINNEEADVKTLASCYNNLATIYMDTEEYDKALEVLSTGKKILKGSEEQYSLMINCLNSGVIYLDKKMPALSLEMLTEAEAIAKQNDYSMYAHHINNLITEAYIDLQHFKAAQTYNKIVVSYCRENNIRNDFSASAEIMRLKILKEFHDMYEAKKEYDHIEDWILLLNNNDLHKDYRNLNPDRW